MSETGEGAGLGGGEGGMLAASVKRVKKDHRAPRGKAYANSFI